MFGSGGSLLAFPIFVHLFSFSPLTATSYSLGVVFVGAIISFLRLKQSVTVPLRESLLFAVPSAITVFLTRTTVLPKLPTTLTSGSYNFSQSGYITVLFVTVALFASYSMFKHKNVAQDTSLATLPFFGAFTGLLTGIIGSGGGFVIIPILKRYAGMQLAQAISTSLLLIILNSFIGITASMNTERSFDLTILTTASFFVVIGAVLGSLSSTLLHEKLKEKILGTLILVVAVITALLM